MREYHYLLERKTPFFSHLILWLTLTLLISAVIWAHHAEIDEVTRGVGKVIPSRQVQVVQNLEGGIISEILIQEGDIVDAGQILLRIDDTRFASSYREGQLKSSVMQAKIARLTAEAKGQTFRLPSHLDKTQRELFANERALAQSRKQTLEANISILNQQKHQKKQEIDELKSREQQLQQNYALAQKELNITTPLVEKGVMSEIELLRLQREVSHLKGELETTRLNIPRVRSAITEADKKIAELKINFRTQALTELNDIKAELAQVSEIIRVDENRVRRTAVRSPVKGTVKQIKVNTIGGVIQPGMDLVEIVPLEDSLLVEAQIRPSDIAFLHPGQEVTVKVTAYDFSIFGGLKAYLEHISADTIINDRGDAFFLIRVRTQRNYLGTKAEPLPIIPGMTVTVDILTGKKTLLTYLLKPIKKAQQLALRER
ncbi:MAG: HlyD family type I secretion periplasmic adaptor subunit [Pseudomonadota bacterium]|nr:HlyD family type I secretion periplasmic adaptor subunit [Pseudomonadota bacterium]